MPGATALRILWDAERPSEAVATASLSYELPQTKTAAAVCCSD
jgi:hypothetical protein